MSTSAPSKKSAFEFILTFILLYFVTNAALTYFFPEQFGGKIPVKEVRLSMESSRVRVGNDPVVFITNTTEKDVLLPKRCPKPPVDITYIEKASDGSETTSELIPNESALPCTDLLVVKAGAKERVSLAGWKYAVLGKSGVYELSLDLPEGTQEGDVSTVSTRFTLSEPGFFTKVFRTFVSKPLFNALIFVATWTPGHNLGLAIIILTLLVKLALLIPNQHALEGQKKLQSLQPKMDEVKKKYVNDPTRIQEETMKLWKEMKINPLQSCLPTLFQLPILIGLFFVIRDGAHLATMQHLVYPLYQTLPANFFGTTLFGFDLLKPEVIIAPISLVVLQFIQMKMMMSRKKSTTEIVVKPTGKKSWMPDLDQQTIMMYVLPFMIGYFAIKFPAAVSIYWGISTLFGIAQQWFVMKKK